MITHWLHLVSIFALVLGFAAAGVIMIDEVGHPQHMWIMNVVWPVVALFGTVLTIWAYFRFGRRATMEAAMNAKSGGRELSGKSATPFPVMVGKGHAPLRQRLHTRRYLRRVAGLRLPRNRRVVRLALAFQREDIRRLGARLYLRFCDWHRVSIFYDRADAPFEDDGGNPGGAEGGCAVADGLADRNVWLHGLREPLLFPAGIRRRT